MSLNTGQVIHNRYRIVKLLGQGGFGAVYKAWDTTLNGPCALKESLDLSSANQQQFALEASLLFNLRHPNVPRVFDQFNIAGQGQYLVMDFIEGEDLQAVVDRTGQAIPEAQAVKWITQICDALTYLHSQNPPVIHRDIKPANIKVTPTGQAVLVDFGISKIFSVSRHTATGARAVTPGYSPPEQYVQSMTTDARSDVYALGATLYSLLTGAAPVESTGRNIGVPIPPPRSFNVTVSPQVEQAVMKALEMKPTDRHQTAQEFKASLQISKTQFAPLPFSPSTPPAQVAPSPPRNPTSVWAIMGGTAVGTFLVGALVIGVGLAILFNLPVPTRTPIYSTPSVASTSTLSPTSTQRIQTPTVPRAFPTDTSFSIATSIPAQSQGCPGTRPTRLRVGDRAYVSFDPPDPNRVRLGPGTQYAVLGQIMPGEYVTILEGPSCANNWTWWRVRSESSGLTGWTSEGDINDYWLVPQGK
jgi:serine/threonine-protein kinase